MRVGPAFLQLRRRLRKMRKGLSERNAADFQLTIVAS
jgi:hypothetical protein